MTVNRADSFRLKSDAFIPLNSFFWGLHWVFIAVHGLSLVAGLLFIVRASHCRGFSCRAGPWQCRGSKAACRLPWPCRRLPTTPALPEPRQPRPLRWPGVEWRPLCLGEQLVLGTRAPSCFGPCAGLGVQRRKTTPPRRGARPRTSVEVQ